MTTIAEIARAADVPVESVLRVLNRDPVSSDVATRVLEAMERYGYGRWPRDAAPRTVSGEVVLQDDADSADVIGRAREQLLNAVGDVVTELEQPGSRTERTEAEGVRPLADRMAVMDALLHRLVQDVEGMKRELGRARNERLEDITLLVDLITTSWRVVDRRLGRIDRKLERLEGLPEHTCRGLPARYSQDR